MNTKWKIILLVMLLIISICAVFMTFFILDSRENLKNFVDTEIASIRAIVETIEESSSNYYRNRIKAFVNYEEVTKQEKIISAFARHDRDELLQLSIPYFTFFKKENTYFTTFSWITSDNYAFLRVQRPSLFGDYLGMIRPDIIDANKEHRQHASYLVSKGGLQYRIVQPVSYEGRHVGVLQFGLDSNLLLDVIHNKLNLFTGIVFTNEKFSIVTRPKFPPLVSKTHTIQSKDVNFFQLDDSAIDWNLKQQKITLQGRTYIIANALNLLNHKQELQAYIFVAMDISQKVEKLQSRIIFILVLSTALLLVSFLILYSSYGSLIQKIINLNKTLQENNQNLESQVKQRTLSLQQQKEQLQRYITGIDDIGIGLCVIDSDYRLHTMNNTLIHRLGNLNDKRCHSVIMELETPCSNCKLKEVIEQEQMVNYQVTRSDGRIIEIVASPIYNEDGSISCLEIIRDITDQKKQEKQKLEINQQKEQLNKFESLKTMAGAIAHRFNNAMMVVNGNLELVIHLLPDSSEEYKMISDAAQAAKGASQVGSMMLSYVGQQPLELQDAPLETLVSESVIALKSLSPSSISLQVTPPDQPLYCSMDRKQIKEVIESILTNASESLGENTGIIDITFGTDNFTADSFPIPFQNDQLQDGMYAYCQIKDSGHGISPKDLSRIFEPFYTTKFVGRGLGLALTVGIMQSHHGAITIESIPSQGTTVRLLLPVISSIQQTASYDDTVQSEDVQFSGNILLADDEEMVLDVGRRMLEQLGFTVHTAINGQDAVSMIRKNDIEFCAVVLDISMPEMDGIEAMKAIRKSNSTLPILLSSGYSEDDFPFSRGEGSKPDGFLSKPFELSGMRSSLEKLLS